MFLYCSTIQKDSKAPGRIFSTLYGFELLHFFFFMENLFIHGNLRYTKRWNRYGEQRAAGCEKATGCFYPVLFVFVL